METAADTPDLAPLHYRKIDAQGFLRADGLYVLKLRLCDTREGIYENGFVGHVAPGEPIHDMMISLVLDPQYTVVDINAESRANPYPGVCEAIEPSYKVLIGAVIGPGWTKEVRRKMGGVSGCTHLTELLCLAATPAYLTLYLHQSEIGGADEDVPLFIDSCHALRANGAVVASEYPAFREKRK